MQNFFLDFEHSKNEAHITIYSDHDVPFSDLENFLGEDKEIYVVNFANFHAVPPLLNTDFAKSMSDGSES
jgi:hypothetical protein